MKQLNKYIGLLVFLCYCFSGLIGQEQKTDIKKAEDAFERNDYAIAAMLYEKNLKQIQNNPAALSKLAFSYKEINKFDLAAKYYRLLIGLKPISPIEWLYFGEVLKSKENYVEAKTAFENYQKFSGKTAQRKIDGCDSALKWINKPLAIGLKNLQDVNTSKSEWGAVIYEQKNKLVFVSDSLRNKKDGFFQTKFNNQTYGRTANNFQKIYLYNSAFDKAIVNQITDFSDVMNHYFFHTGPVVFNAFYDTAFFTVTNDRHKGEKGFWSMFSKNSQQGVNRLELYLSTRTISKTWSQPQPFAYNNPKKYSVGHAALSNDGTVLYFISDMPGGIGGLDLWYCEKLENNTWSEPQNCGVLINTPENEAFPTIAPDGSLYFSSKGLIGMGGYDLFVTKGSKNVWTVPQNLKSPFNSGGDDFGISFITNESGYLSSNRLGGKGDDDIYYFSKSKGDKQKNGPVVLETTVLDKRTNLPISKVEIATNKAAQTDTLWTRTNANGKTVTPVEMGINYHILSSKEGYIPVQSWVPDVAVPVDDTIRLLVLMENDPRYILPIQKPQSYLLDEVVGGQSLQEGDKIIIKNLYYDFDKHNIRPDAAKVLDTLVQIMNKYSSMHIELSSHTDSRGTDAYNMVLSDKRAKSAVQYLIEHGIAANRMYAKGYGETKLVNDCVNDMPCTEPEHQANRRTEVTILKM